MTARTTKRGFTLIELLVVLAILAVLAGLIMAGVMRVRIGQQVKTTEETIKKLESGLTRQRTGVLDTARLGTPLPIVMQLADNDPDRAKILWAYLKYKRAFPERFDEANPVTATGIPVPMPIYDPTVLAPTPIYLPEFAPPSIFSTLPVVSGTIPAGYTAADVADIEAAACAYLFMTKRAERGEVSSMDEGMGSLSMEIEINVTTGYAPKRGLYKVRVFKDTFNRPITFRRFFTHPELNGPPHVKLGSPSFDPFDPLARLQKYDTTKPAAVNARNKAHLTIYGTEAPFDPLNNLTGTFLSASLDGRFNTTDDIPGFRFRQGN